MSAQNVEIAKRANDAFNRRDVDAFMECVTPDIEFTAAMSGTVAGGSLRGREGIEALFADIRDTWEEHRMVIEEIRDLGERVLGLGRLEGRGRGSGVSVDVPFALISDFRDGKMWRSRTYLDHGEALRAAGLEEYAVSEDDLDLVRKWWDAWNRVDLDTVVAMLDADAELITDPSFAEAGTFRGRQAIRNWLEGLKESWEGDQVVLTELFDIGGKVVSRIDWLARGRASGMETRMEMTAVLTIKDNKIVLVQYYFEHATALKAVGLEE